ncbi:ATP-binding protein [Delftia tsuruhatensis]|uniref:ATP-binding protein n=1 Tax=Delftia tsuruhatensis TaxID=180282 RepID=UPI001F3369C8|nr:ATP-binding protein [Delftia tsuruhatensis]
MEARISEEGEKRDLYLLNRYNKTLLLGGGLVFTLLVIVVALVALLAEFNEFMEERRASFQDRRTRILVEIETKQVIVMRGIVASELIWGHAHESRSGIWRQPEAGGVIPVTLLEGFESRQLNDEYGVILEELAYLANSSFLQHGKAISAYVFSPDGKFIGALIDHVPDDVERDAILQRLKSNISRIYENDGRAGRTGAPRQPIWLAPERSVLTGDLSFQIMATAFQNEKPFLTVVSDMPTDYVASLMEQNDVRGSFFIMDSAGGIALGGGAEVRATADRAVMQGWKRQEGLLAKYILSRYGSVYENGLFYYRSDISNTNMSLFHVFSWKDAVYLKGRSVVYLFLAAAFILFFWGFLFYFYERIFVPIYRKARHVFDSEQLSRTIMAMAPYGLGVLDIKRQKMLLENGMMQLCKDSMVLHGKGQKESLMGYFCRINAERNSPRREDGHAQVNSEIVIERDGDLAELSTVMVKTRYRGRNVLLCGFADITAHKQLHRNLERARKTAEDASKEKSNFLAVMSHEIRTPLNAILGNLEILSRGHLSDPQKARLDVISSSSQSLLQLLNDVLDFSKIESGQMSVELAGFDLRAAIQHVASIYEPLVLDAGMEFFVVADESLRGGYLGDVERVKQIMNNLLSNAVKFTRQGRIGIHASESSGQVRIVVSDTGIGIPSSQHPFIFDAFRQAGAGISAQFGGTGLGLTLCQRMARLMGGEIRFSSRPGLGSQFELSFPAHHAEPALLPQDRGPEDDVAVMEGNSPCARILVVDDHPVNRMLLVDQLRIVGCAADAAPGGEIALRMMAEQTYDLVITDLQMPGMSGYLLARHIRQKYPHIPVGAITAHAGKDEKARCLQFGISDIIFKPASLGNIKIFVARNIVKKWNVSSASEDNLSAGVSAYLDMLISTTEDSLALLKNCMELKDTGGMRQEIHAMKGAFAVAGMSVQLAYLEKISSLIESGEWRCIDAVVADLRDSLGKL